jgi:hypothetical protein
MGVRKEAEMKKMRIRNMKTPSVQDQVLNIVARRSSLGPAKLAAAINSIHWADKELSFNVSSSLAVIIKRNGVTVEVIQPAA